jgi:hypothetical protein
MYFKFTILIALITTVSAKLYIILPDRDSTWYTGSTGVVQWNTSATEFGLQCNIQLIDAKTRDIALNITNSSIPCSIDTFNTSTLPKFENKDFLIRIGENSNTSVWSYTQNFKILPAQ